MPDPRPARRAHNETSRQDRLQLVDPGWTTRDGLLQITSSNERGHWTLKLQGELDLSNVASFDEAIRLAGGSAQTLTIDLGELSFMDSSGLRTILAANNRSHDNGALRLLRGPRNVQPVFGVTRTERDLPFEPPLQDRTGGT